MTLTVKNFKTIASSLILLSITLGITLAYASTENNYKNDSNFLTGISESTHAESGYEAYIIINPYVTGVLAKEGGFTLDLTINPQGIGGAFAEGNYRLDLVPENSFPDWADMGVTKTASIAGDTNGDGKVSLADLVILAQAYGSHPGDAKWNPNADIDGNGIVGLSDLVILAQHYGQHNP